jgi:CHASE2 domain-containing sensor protein
MWFGTDHIMTKNNYNILWALPTNLIAAFFIKSKQKFVRYYFIFIACFLSLVLICWNFLPQQLNVSLIPIMLSLIVRSYCIISQKLNLK